MILRIGISHILIWDIHIPYRREKKKDNIWFNIGYDKWLDNLSYPITNYEIEYNICSLIISHTISRQSNITSLKYTFLTF